MSPLDAAEYFTGLPTFFNGKNVERKVRTQVQNVMYAAVDQSRLQAVCHHVVLPSWQRLLSSSVCSTEE